MKYFLLICFTIVLIISVSISADTSVPEGSMILFGKIYDIETNEIIRQGKVVITVANDTDIFKMCEFEDGRWDTNIRLRDKYFLEVSSNGYHQAKISFSLPNRGKISEISEIDFYLKKIK